MDWIKEELLRTDARLLLRRPTQLVYDSPTTARIDGRPCVVFCSNDYLGLRLDPRLTAAAVAATTHYGTGAGASRLVSGHLEIYERAEQALAALVGTEAALILSSGFATNIAALPALAGPEDVVFSDVLNHASIVDGCRLSRARVVVYPHANLAALQDLVTANRPFRRAWVVTESLFSMDGDLCPLPAVRALCDREGLHLYVDDAHALGVVGEHGEGAVRSAGIRADVMVATLGKALGGAGAFVAGSHDLQLYLWNKCRSFVFSTAVPPATAATAIEATTIVRDGHALRTALRANIEHLRGELARFATIGGAAGSPIVPLVIGDEGRVLELGQRLREGGFFVQPIRPPTVPRGTARLRITVSAAHTPEQIDALVAALHQGLGAMGQRL